MTVPRFALALTLAAAAAPGAIAQSRYTAPARAAAASAKSDVVSAVAPALQDAVAKVMKSPTLTTKAAEAAFPVHANVYKWMLEHPDRVSLGWQRLQVECVEITDAGNGKFVWTDDQGSELTWQVAGRLPDGVVWYATGKVKAAALFPMVPVRAVAVLRHPETTDAAGGTSIRPDVMVYLQTDSRAATAVLRIAGPAAPKMAEQAAEQLLYFFSGVAKHLYTRPDHVKAVLGPKVR